VTCSFLSSNFFDHWIKLVLRNLKGSSWNEHYETQWLHHWFILWEFPVILQKGFLKKYILWQILCFFPKKPVTKKPKEIAKSCHNCLKHESVLKIFYFHILNITKFVQIYLWMIITKATPQKTHTHTIGMHSCKGYLFKPKLKIELKKI
jgi:hypothetical protein